MVNVLKMVGVIKSDLVMRFDDGFFRLMMSVVVVMSWL